MGCCFSRSTGPNSPYPGGAPNSSARAINPPPLNLNDSAQPAPDASTPQSPSRRRRSKRPLDQHIDKPLRRHSWTSKDRTWTKRELARERRDFFDTRVTGRSEVWQTIHAALEVLWEPTPEESDGTESLALAQTILSAAEISLPTGNLANGVYDSLGNYYPLQEWIVCDPTNVTDDGGADDGLQGRSGDSTGEDEDEPGSEGKREEKGKAVVDVREQVTLRARLSEDGRDCEVLVTPSESVRSVAKKVAEVASLPADKKIRLAYMGKILRENVSLEAQGWHHEHIINALVFNR